MAIDFEKIHEEFDDMMLNLCTECGGQCEQNEITLLLPGEAEFVAKKLGLTVKEFVEKFCNKIKFKGREVLLLKVGVCPFLNSEYRCALEKPNCKITRCLLYPVIIGLSEKRPKIFVDYLNCPMAGRVSVDYKKKATEVYEEIKHEIPRWWLEFVSKYDEITYDYTKLEKLRDKKSIFISDLKQCAIKRTT